LWLTTYVNKRYIYRVSSTMVYQDLRKTHRRYVLVVFNM